MTPARCGLAANPALPAHLLARLVETADDELGPILAARADLTREHARTLAARCGPGVLYPLLGRGLLGPADVPFGDPWRGLAVLEHPDADPAWFERLARDPDPVIRSELSARFPLPEPIIDLLAADPELGVVTSVARCRPPTARLAADPRHAVRRALAANEQSPPDLLRRLAREAGNCRRSPVAWEPGAAPTDLLADLLTALAGNPATPPDCLPADGPALVRWAMASRTDLAGDVYAKLAEDDLPGVRWDLARNPAAVGFLPRLLTRDRGREIRHAAAHNPHVPLDLLARLAPGTRIGRTLVPRVAAATEAELRLLAGSPAAQVRRLVAVRPDLPHDLVTRFAEDPDAGVARAVAPNPALTPAQLRTLARHGPAVSARIAENPRCPADLARALLAGAPVRALRVLARHPGLVAESIVVLLGHADDGVVTAAAANPALPVAVLSTLTGSTPEPGNSHGIGAALKKLR
ncbi:hypothetical protein [Amycolatopsis sp. MtRt-6]|uniref:hypothetical protein n=1 Tax=Amycolatopsis sp. MtRt-6 TaxID=2792782 RepID=UPI001A90B0D9|nr:hypothetical protein [Amycolatopsis sp. MtRt-6]